MEEALSRTVKILGKLVEQSPSSSDRSPCVEVAQLLAACTQHLREDQTRDSLACEALLPLCGALSSLSQQLCDCLPNDHRWSVVCPLLRCLRNACVNQEEKQLLIASSGVLSGISHLLHHILEELFHNTHEDFAKENGWPIVRVATQLAGNVCAGNSATARVVWQAFFPVMFCRLLSSDDSQTNDYAAMVIYNCLLHQADCSRVLGTTKEGRPVIMNILQACQEKESEWLLLLGQHLVCGDNFPAIYKQLQGYTSSRLILLELLAATLPDGGQTQAGQKMAVSRKSEASMSDESLQFLAKEFEDRHARLKAAWTQLPPQLIVDTSAVSDLPVVLELMIVVQILSVSSGRSSRLADRQSFFLTALDLLTHTQPPDSSKAKQVTSLADSKAFQDHPLYCLRRDCMCIVANCLAGRAANKDLLCKRSGMLALLSGCGIDNLNPFIGEWAIVAIRNACEDHQGNQAVISQLKQSGVADAGLLRTMGIDVSVGDDGKLQVKPVKREDVES